MNAARNAWLTNKDSRALIKVDDKVASSWKDSLVMVVVFN
jgi:hypothetical protein